MGFGATFVGRFGREFWRAAWALGPLFVKDTFVRRFSKVAYIELYFYNIKIVF